MTSDKQSENYNYELQGSPIDIFMKKLLDHTYDKLEKGLEEDSKNCKIRDKMSRTE